MAPQWRLTKTVALVGLMGAGKTAVGRSLAQLLDVPFTDSDHEIEAAANSSITEIFEEYGEAFFRAREAEVIARLLAAPPGVLSLGGGAWVQERTRTMIEEQAVALWLDPPVSVLWQRVRLRDTRPLLRVADPRGTLERLHESRAPIYAQAPLRLHVTAEDDVDATVQGVVGTLLSESDALVPA